MNTSARSPKHVSKLIVVAMTSVLLASCAGAPTQPEGAADVRSKLTQLQSDPQLASRAPVAIKEAEAAVIAAEQPQKDKALARDLWEQCKTKIASGDYDVVALDEFTYPLAYGWLPVDEVIDFLKSRPARTHVIITGRDAPQELIDYADLVTEMREVKHPFQHGLKAQPGIEF